MRSYIPLGLVGTPTAEAKTRALAWLKARLEEVPPQFKARGHGPIMAMPHFLKKLVYAEFALGRFAGYEVAPGYEFAVVLFFREQGGLNEKAVYRIELQDMLALSPGVVENPGLEPGNNNQQKLIP